MMHFPVLPNRLPMTRLGSLTLGFMLSIGLALVASTAFAVDGVIEINHASVLAGGITPSDTPGYPATIDTGGSYRLTSNLDVPSTIGVRGITILDGAVTLDLNGFTVLGPGSCTGIPPSCSGDFATVGIEISTSHPVRILNGALTGLFSAVNVTATTGNQTRSTVLENLAIEGNSGTAVFLSGSGASVIRDCQISRNGLVGVDIDLTHPTLVDGVVFRSNGGTAIDSQGSASLVRNSEFVGNSTGIRSFFLSNPSSALIYGNNHFYANSTNVTGGTQMGLNICVTSACP
jgi:hypothetical protein